MASAFAQGQRILQSASVSALQPDQALEFVDGRLRALQKVSLEPDAYSQQPIDLMHPLQGDAGGLAEVALVGREALWQLQTIFNACQRRWLPGSEVRHAVDEQWSSGASRC